MSIAAQTGSQYLVRVQATDAVGVSGFADSSPVRIVGETHNLTPAQVTLVVALTVAGSVVAAAVITFFVIRHRYIIPYHDCHCLQLV